MISSKHKKIHKRSCQEPPQASTLGLLWRKYGQPKIPHSRSKLTPLNMTRTEIFLQIKENEFLKDPLLMRTPLERRDKLKYYHFHGDYGYNTKECYDMKD